MGSLGEALRRAREQQGLSLQQVCEATHINLSYLQALENEEADAFPADVYARGFLRSYASFLGLDPAPLLEDFTILRNPTPTEAPGIKRRQSRAALARAERRLATRQRVPEEAQAVTRSDLGSAGRPLFPYAGDRQTARAPYFLWLLVLLLVLAGAVLFGPLHGLSYLRGWRSRITDHRPVTPPAHRRPAPRIKMTPQAVHAAPRPGAPLTLVLQSTGWVFIQVTTDVGKERVYQGEWYPGLQKTWWGRKRIDVYADRGNNVLATFDGTAIGRLASRRQRVWRSFPAGATPATPDQKPGSITAAPPSTLASPTAPASVPAAHPGP